MLVEKKGELIQGQEHILSSILLLILLEHIVLFSLFYNVM